MCTVMESIWLHATCRLRFPPLYSLATRSSLLGWRISSTGEMNAFWRAGVLSACSRRSIVWFDIQAGHGTSDLAALTHLTQPLVQGAPKRKLNHADRKRCCLIGGTKKETLSVIDLLKKKWWTLMKTLLAFCWHVRTRLQRESLKRVKNWFRLLQDVESQH